eukprot:gene794-1270_t
MSRVSFTALFASLLAISHFIPSSVEATCSSGISVTVRCHTGGKGDLQGWSIEGNDESIVSEQMGKDDTYVSEMCLAEGVSYTLQLTGSGWKQGSIDVQRSDCALYHWSGSKTSTTLTTDCPSDASAICPDGKTAIIVKSTPGAGALENAWVLENLGGTKLDASGVSTVSPRTYVTQTGTCQNAKSLGGDVGPVDSVAECQAKCDANSECIAIDQGSTNCYLKSYCEGTVGSCSGWCSYVAVERYEYATDMTYTARTCVTEDASFQLQVTSDSSNGGFVEVMTVDGQILASGPNGNDFTSEVVGPFKSIAKEVDPLAGIASLESVDSGCASSGGDGCQRAFDGNMSLPLCREKLRAQ